MSFTGSRVYKWIDSKCDKKPHDIDVSIEVLEKRREKRKHNVYMYLANVVIGYMGAIVALNLGFNYLFMILLLYTGCIYFAAFNIVRVVDDTELLIFLKKMLEKEKGE